MTDRDALYAAILAHPDEDTPRLLYADWLEEHGQAKAANYIRAACELARLDDDDPSLAAFPTEAPAFWSDLEPEVARRQALAAVALPRDHAKSELARLPERKGFGASTARTEGSPFRRGFVERACFKTAADFVRHADDVFRAAPIRELLIVNPSAGGLERLASSRWFPQVRTLILGIVAGPDGGSRTWEYELRGLCEEGSVERLTALTLGNADPDCLRVLAGARDWRGLRRLSIKREHYHYTDPSAEEQFTELIGAKHLRKLVCLEIDFLSIGSEGSDALASARYPEMRSLTFRFEHFDVGPMMAAVKSMPKLRALALPHCALNGSEIAEIVCSPHARRLASLDLTETEVEGFGKKEFVGARAESLHRLVVSAHFNRMTDKWAPLFQWVARSNVASFALDGGGISAKRPDPSGLRALVECGPFPQLRRIGLPKLMMTSAIKKHFGPRLREWSPY